MEIVQNNVYIKELKKKFDLSSKYYINVIWISMSSQKVFSFFFRNLFDFLNIYLAFLTCLPVDQIFV